jgi:hypothetical protein
VCRVIAGIDISRALQLTDILLRAQHRRNNNPMWLYTLAPERQREALAYGVEQLGSTRG